MKQIDIIVHWTIDKYIGFDNQTGNSKYDFQHNRFTHTNLLEALKHVDQLERTVKEEFSRNGKVYTKNIRVTLELDEPYSD